MTKSWLTENNVPFIEKNVENEENRMELINRGYKVTPVTMVGDTAIVGYNSKELRKAFSK
tara:strand:+ start:133 stop:312 length:180 start_codon:yes stop_codon:yes gene_type:complete